MSAVITLFIIALGIFWLSSLRQRARLRQLGFIEDYEFPPAVRNKFHQRRPELNETEVDQVFEGLRDWFEVCNKAGRRMVAMPSQAVDDAWHEFILFTRAYQEFCKKALGRFLHHTPAEAMRGPKTAQEGIRRAWRLACSKERINPRTPTRLPQLFAMDAKLGILNGFYYALNCMQTLAGNPQTSAVYCGSHIGCASGCGGDSGGSGDSGSSSDPSSGGDGGGSGCSSGCSGGCGGGGD
jgi:hypothetical protein